MRSSVWSGGLAKKFGPTQLACCLFAITVLLAGCASGDRKSAPTGLSSSALLQRDAHHTSRWAYKPGGIDISTYHRFLFESVAVFTGPEAQFGDMPMADRQRLATIVGEEFVSVFGQKYPIAYVPGSDVASVRLTLLGVERTIGGLATVTRVLPTGILMNAVKGSTGGSGTFTGSIELAIEVFDSQKNNLLTSEIRRDTPAVYDIEATLSTRDTVRSAARAMAISLRDDFGRPSEKQGNLQR